jgi:hypothetical protein
VANHRNEQGRRPPWPIGALPCAIIALGCVLLSVRCTSVAGQPPSLVRGAGIRTVVLVPPDVMAYRVSAEGRVEPAEESSELARSNFAKAVALQAAATGTAVFGQPEHPLTAAADEELRDIRPLFAVVVATAMAHACGTRCPDEDATWETRNARFEHSLGPLPALAEATGADTVLLMYMRTRVPTTGEVVGKSAAVVLSLAAFMAVGVLVYVPPAELLIQALVDIGTGDLLWTDVVVPRFIFPDLRDPAVVDSLVADAFAHVAAARPSRRTKQE